MSERLTSTRPSHTRRWVAYGMLGGLALSGAACSLALPDLQGEQDGCTPIACQAEDCGPVFDGCAAVLDCGSCAGSGGGATGGGGDGNTSAGVGGAGGGSNTSSSGSGGGPTPFWQFSSANLSTAEIAAYNDPNTGMASLGTNQTFHFDTDHADNWWRRAGGQTPNIDANGQLHSVRLVSDPNKHSGIEAWANGAGMTTEPYDRSFPLHRRYRFGFDVFVPGSAAQWKDTIDWALFMQNHQANDGSNDPPVSQFGGRNPAMALNIEAVNGQSYWTVAVRGDDRLILPDKNYQYQVNEVLAPLVNLNTWYTFVVEVVWSYSGQGETKVWLDGNLVYDNSASITPGFKNCFNDVHNNVNHGPLLPYFGLYNYDLPASPMELNFDNMWITDLGMP